MKNVTPPPQNIEVVDSRNRPLMEMPIDEAHRQMLPHRSVAVLVHDEENRLYLQQRSADKTFYPGRWDVSASGHVLVGESTKEAALRVLFDELRIRADRLRHIREIPASPATGFEYVSVYSAGRSASRPAPNREEIEGGYFYSREELACLISEFRELLTPGLISLWERGLPFPEE